jgi:hypothetical protein
MKTPLANLTTDQIKAADRITAVDPKQTSYGMEVWQQCLNLRPPPSGPHQDRAIEVQIDSTQNDQLQDLLRRVEAVKGHHTLSKPA